MASASGEEQGVVEWLLEHLVIASSVRYQYVSNDSACDEIEMIFENERWRHMIMAPGQAP